MGYFTMANQSVEGTVGILVSMGKARGVFAGTRCTNFRYTIKG